MKALANLLGKRSAAASAAPAAPPAAQVTTRQCNASPAPPNPGFMPSVDPGFVSLPVHEALKAHDALLGRIRLCYGSDPTEYERTVLRLIMRYADFVHLLPATPDNHHNVPGGLLQLGLEVGFFALQGTDAHIFSGRSTISVRRHLEPRWRLATFAAGLCAEVHRTLSHVIVTDAAGNAWQPYLMPLAHWMASMSVERYYLKWMPNVQESRGLGVFALPHIIPADMLADLAAENAVVVPHMMASICGMPTYREHNMLDALVRRANALVIDQYLQASVDRYGKPMLGSHLERYLVDALRRLVATNSGWAPNAEKSRVWFGSDGVFLIWPSTAADIRKLLESDQLPGIPKAPETIVEVLLGAGVLEPTSTGQAVWTILPPSTKATAEAVKLASAGILFAGIQPSPQPLAARLEYIPSNEPRPATPPTPGASPSSTEEQPEPSHADKAPVGSQLPLPTMHATTRARRQRGREAGQQGLEAATNPKSQPGIATLPEAFAPKTDQGAQQTDIQTAPHEPFQIDGQARASRLKLNSPFRLPPHIRDALAQIVDSLNEPGSAMACRTTAHGIFIPLAELQRRHIEPSLAMRTLGELRMLVQTSSEAGPIAQQDFGGALTSGLVLRPDLVDGLDASAFLPPA